MKQQGQIRVNTLKAVHLEIAQLKLAYESDKAFVNEILTFLMLPEDFQDEQMFTKVQYKVIKADKEALKGGLQPRYEVMLFLLKTGPQQLFEMFINRLLDYLIVEESASPWGLNLPDLNTLSDATTVGVTKWEVLKYAVMNGHYQEQKWFTDLTEEDKGLLREL